MNGGQGTVQGGSLARRATRNSAGPAGNYGTVQSEVREKEEDRESDQKKGKNQ